MEVFGLDLAASEKASEINARLIALGTPVNALDVLIAGIAKARGAERIVTKDRDFLRISQVGDIDVLIY